MSTLRIALAGLVISACSCPPLAHNRGSGKDGSGQTDSPTSEGPVLHPVHKLDVDLDRLAGGTFTPGARVIGVGDTASFELPGPFPGKIAHVAADGKVSVVEGRLVSDVPLRFAREGDHVRAQSFDGAVVYTAVERVTAAEPWSATAASSGCCGWWEHTLWRGAPRALDAGLLRVVTPPTQAWSVIDFHRPQAIEPAWRVSLTERNGVVVAAAVSPRADQLAVVVASLDGSATLQARNATDGTIIWSVDLGAPATEWRRGDGRIVYRHDGTRIAVLTEDRKRCESCTALEVYDATRGERLQRFAIESVIAPRFSTIGLSGDTAWIFEFVPPTSSELSKRPQRCQYESHDAGGNKRRPAPPADWGLSDCTVWALAPRFDGPGVVALAQRGSSLLWLTADRAP